MLCEEATAANNERLHAADVLSTRIRIGTAVECIVSDYFVPTSSLSVHMPRFMLESDRKAPTLCMQTRTRLN